MPNSHCYVAQAHVNHFYIVSDLSLFPALTGFEVVQVGLVILDAAQNRVIQRSQCGNFDFAFHQEVDGSGQDRLGTRLRANHRLYMLNQIAFRLGVKRLAAEIVKNHVAMPSVCGFLQRLVIDDTPEEAELACNVLHVRLIELASVEAC